MNVTKTLVVAGFAVLFMLVWNCQSSFGQQGHTFRTGSSPVDSSPTTSKARSFRTPGTPSMRRPTNRGRSIGVAGVGNAAAPVGGEGAVGARGGERSVRPGGGDREVGPVGGEDLAAAAEAARQKRDAARRGQRSIGVGAVGGGGYSNIHRKSSRTTRPPKAGGATAQFF